jgi:hypothetical protein
VRDFRRNGDAAVAPGNGASVGTPGKRTLTEQLGARVERRGAAQTTGSATTAGVVGQEPAPDGPSVEDPFGGPSEPPIAAARTRTTVSFTESTAPPLTFNAKDYRELYGQVAERMGKEAGTVTRSAPKIVDGAKDPDGNIATCAITYDLATMLPEWPQKGSQPAEDQAKFNAWRASVAAHEKGHRDIYKRELGKERAEVVGPKAADIDAQIAAVQAVAETAQDAWDHAGQPAPLAAPGGIE